jgi:hypothetical protein
MKLWILGLSLLVVGTAIGQTNSKTDRTLSMSTLSIGGGLQEFDGLNSRIDNNNAYRTLRDYTALLHLGFMKERNRFISMINLGLGSTMSGDRQRRSSTVRFIGVGADIGYDLVAAERVMFYPLVGLGYEWYQAKFFRDVSNLSFNEVIQNPLVQPAISPIAFTNSFFNYKVGLGVNLFAPHDGGASIGLQAAYVGSFQDREWRSREGQELGNAPEDRLGRFQVSIVLTHSRRSYMRK